MKLVNYIHEVIFMVFYEDFFYYEEEYYLRKKRKDESRYSSHIWEDDDFLCETRGRIRPRILEEVRGRNLFYYIELPGILSRDDIEVELQSNIITVRAKLRKGVVYQGVTKELNVSEYLADIILPYAPSPDDIRISFDRRRGLLIISVSRRGEKKRLGIEEI